MLPNLTREYRSDQIVDVEIEKLKAEYPSRHDM